MAKVIERIEYPDGSALEVTVSGAVNGPDQVGGLNFGTTYVYLRAEGRAWRKTRMRSLHKTLMAARICSDAADAYDRVGESEVA